MEQTKLNRLASRANPSTFLTALSLMVMVCNAPAFTYTNFNSTNGLNLVGASAVVGGALRLTPAAEESVGTAWALAKQPCSGGFDTQFRFQNSNVGSRPGTPIGGDGIVFTIQKIGPTDPTYHVLLSPADGSVSVFFNTFWNWPDSTDFTQWDVSGNSVGVLSNALYLAQTDLTPRGINLKDGAVHSARISFDGTSLTVWLDGGMVLTNVPVPGMASAVDAAGEAWVGFGAGTGWAWENHDILSWSFSSPSSACVSPPSGLVAWWRAEGNGNDALESNNGVLVNGVGFTNGVVGQAFAFDGADDAVIVSNAPVLNFGSGQDFSIEAWIEPLPSTTFFGVMSIVDKRLSPSWTQDVGYEFNLGDGQLHFRMSDSLSGPSYSFGPAGPDMRDGKFHHVAVTVARNSATGGKLYVDGQVVLTFDPTVAVGNLSNAEPLCIGVNANSTFFSNFKGAVDEVSLYNRALTAAEIQTIRNAGSVGKCASATPPAIAAQPSGQTVNVGATVTLSVSASGTPPLSYQWRLNGTDLAGASGASLRLANIQLADAGYYSVRVTNAFGSVTSSNARLTVTPATTNCVSAPGGLVGWWPGENSTADAAGGNSGTVAGYGTFGYGPGVVGQAFVFDGIHRDRVDLGNPASLQLQDFTIEAWIKRSSATDISLDDDNQDGAVAGEGGIVFGYGRGGYGLGVLNNGQLILSRIDVDGILSTNVVVDTNWHHVAVTKSGSTAEFYIDGVSASGPISYSTTYTFDTSAAIGSRGDARGGTFWGLVDEPSVYSRALSSAEIQALYAAGATGKCPLPPTVLVQPNNQMVTAGRTVTFSVLAGGAPPLSYRWRKGGVNLADGGRVSGADAPTLTISGAQISDAGTYSLLLTNAVGSVASSNAVLAVLRPPPCAPAPPDLVSWWPGENSTTDVAGGNTGTVAGYGTFGYGPGVVGQAFVFDGIHRDRVDLGNPASLQLQDFTIEAWIKRSSGTHISLDDDNQDGAVAGEGGIVFGYGRGGYGFGLLNNGQLILSRIDLDGILSANVVADTNWHYVAVTKSGSTAVFYIDSTPASAPMSYTTTYTFDTSAAIGSRGDARGGTFWGMVDEPSVYSRALSSAEIQALYAADVTGKCQESPSILVQPASRMVTETSNVMFTVTAAGTPQLRYQWRLNGTDVTGGTGTSLALVNVQATNPGSYSVRVTNAFGSVISSNAVLTVNRIPVAECADVIVSVGANCQADASINNGSFDPDGDPITVSQVPPGPYPLGTNRVTLIVTDDKGASNSCSALVIVLNNLPALTYTNFNSTAGLNLVGTAAVVGGALRLTPAADTVTGAAWALNKQPCSRGFDTSYQFRITNPGSRPGTPAGSDGILFTLQKIGPADPTWHNLGAPADGSVSVCFNTFWNWPGCTDFTHCDVSANSVGVLSNGLYLAQTDLNPRGVNLKDGAVHSARISFDGMGLTVWLDGAMVLTNVPVPGMASAVDAAGAAWVGFDAGTGWAWENHDLLSWSFLGSSCNRAPVAQCANVIVSAGTNCMAGASVDNGSFDPDGDPITLRQVPPGPYPVGTNRVTLTVTDNHGASNSCNALVIVLDQTPPVLVCAPNKQVECGTGWSFDEPSATDNCGAATVTVLSTVTNALCGGTFAATRTWQAVGGSSNTVTCSQTVTIVDTTPPTIVCPASMTLEFQDENGAVASYVITASDTCSSVSLAATPASGSRFPMGVTPVQALTVDACGNSNRCAFTVTVLGAQGVKSNVLAELTALRASLNSSQLFAQKFDDAIEHLAGSLNPAYWIDQTHLQPKGGNTAMKEEKLAANTLGDIMDTKGCPVDPAVLQGLIDRIVRCDRLLAVISIQEAAQAGLNPKKVAEDLALVAKGDEEADKGHYANAIEHYRNAWRHALQLRLQVSLSPNGSTLLQFVGNNSKSYRIEMSTDLLNWASLGTCTADADGNVEFTDPTAANQPLRFYRAVEQ